MPRTGTTHKFSRSAIVCLLALAAAVAALPACAGKRGKPDLAELEGEEAVEYFTHQVRLPGETLSLIAAWYTGSADNWQILTGHNPDLSANRIEIGDTVQIPRLMLTRESPITEQFLRASRREPAEIPPPPKATSEATLTAPKGQEGFVEVEEADMPEVRPVLPPLPPPHPRTVTDDKESLEEWQKRVRDALKIEEATKQQNGEGDTKSRTRYEVLEELLVEEEK